MDAVLALLIRTDLRNRWRAVAGAVLLMAVTVALVMASAAGARRTETAFDRFLGETRAAELFVSAGGEGFDYSTLYAIDGVERVAPLVGVELYPAVVAEPYDVINIGSVDGTFGTEVERPKVLEGRLPDFDSDDEIFVSRRYAADFGVGAGDRMALVAETEPGAVERSMAGDSSIATFDVEIAGVGVFTSDLVPATELDANPTALVVPKLTERILDASLGITGFDGAAITIADGTSVDQVLAAAAAIADEQGMPLFTIENAGTHATVRRALGPQATALWVFAAIVAVAGALLIGHVITRHVALVSDRFVSLRAIGVGRRKLVALTAIESLLLALVAYAIAVPMAVVASALFPIGTAGVAEPDPGVAVNVAIMGSAGLVFITVTCTVGVLAAVRLLHRTDRRTGHRASMIASVASSLGAGPAAVIGLRRAFEAGRDRVSVPVRSGIAGAVVAVTAVVAAATFASGLDALVSEPDRYGQSWSMAFDAQFGPAPSGDLVERYRDDPRVEAMAGIVYGELSIAGQPVAAVGFDPLVGELAPVVVAGRAPTDDEIALGSQTMDLLGVELGDRLEVDGGAGGRSLEIVGRAVFPKLSQGSFNVLGLGTGAVASTTVFANPYERAYLEEGAAAGDLPPGMEVDDFLVDGQSHNAVLFRVAEGHEGDLAAELGAHPLLDYDFATVFVDQRPAAISTYTEIQGTPGVLAAIMAVMGGALVVHVLVTAVRRRRVEVGVCRAMGMRGRDVAAIVGWQATAVAVTALVVGLPLGLAGGRMAWRLFAEELGVPESHTFPWTWVALVAVATLALTNTVGAYPAWRAQRLSTASALRVE